MPIVSKCFQTTPRTIFEKLFIFRSLIGNKRHYNQSSYRPRISVDAQMKLKFIKFQLKHPHSFFHLIVAPYGKVNPCSEQTVRLPPVKLLSSSTRGDIWHSLKLGHEPWLSLRHLSDSISWHSTNTFALHDLQAFVINQKCILDLENKLQRGTHTKRICSQSCLSTQEVYWI